MSEDYLVQQPIAIWNSARGVWEKPGTVNLLCEHLELFSEVWPSSGIMKCDGQVFGLPTPVRLMPDSESSSLPSENLPTPKAMDGIKGNLKTSQERIDAGHFVDLTNVVIDIAQANAVETLDLMPTPKARDHQAEGYEAGLRRNSPQVGTIVLALQRQDDRLDLFPTPNTMEHREIKSPEQIAELKVKSPGGYRNLREEVIHNLPTPAVRDTKDGQAARVRDGVIQTDTVSRTLIHGGEVTLLPTTRVSMANGATSREVAEGNPKSRIEAEVMLGEISWGKFEPAIRRWEAVLGRPSPAPTQPDGKDGAHRLSPWFTEFMMGLPLGWICDPEIGLTRNEMLKACGNGVVSQQAELALRILLDGVDLTKPGGGQ